MYVGSHITAEAREKNKNYQRQMIQSFGYASLVNSLVRVSHGNSVVCGWYRDKDSGAPINRNVGEMIALMHSELSEALEGYRKGEKDDHLPNRPAVEVELADALHRIFD